MNAHELQAIQRICLFTVTLYVKAWFTPPMTCAALYNDLCLVQLIELFDAVNTQIAQVAVCTQENDRSFMVHQQRFGSNVNILGQSFCK